MFERFTSRARHAIVLAQEEARQLRHNYIGTEHILLGLLAEPEGFAAQALDRFGISLAVARDDVKRIIGLGKGQVSGHIPFTPRAKKTLELALREALGLHHNYIGTEHILLGVIREGQGVAAQILRERADLLAIRSAVLDLVPAGQPQVKGRLWLRRLARVMSGEAEGPGGGPAAARLPGSPARTPLARPTRCGPRAPIPTPPPPAPSPRSGWTSTAPGRRCALPRSREPATSLPRKQAGGRCWSGSPTTGSRSRPVTRRSSALAGPLSQRSATGPSRAARSGATWRSAPASEGPGRRCGTAWTTSAGARRCPSRRRRRGPGRTSRALTPAERGPRRRAGATGPRMSGVRRPHGWIRSTTMCSRGPCACSDECRSAWPWPNSTPSPVTMLTTWSPRRVPT